VLTTDYGLDLFLADDLLGGAGIGGDWGSVSVLAFSRNDVQDLAAFDDIWNLGFVDNSTQPLQGGESSPNLQRSCL